MSSLIAINGKTYVADLAWKEVDVARLETEIKVSRFQYGVIRRTKKKALLGHGRSNALGKTSLAALLSQAATETRLVITPCLTQDGRSVLHGSAMMNGMVMPGGDRVLITPQDAAAWARDFLLLTPMAVHAPKTVEVLLSEYMVTPLDFDALIRGAREKEAAVIDYAKSKSASPVVLATLLGMILSGAGGGYWYWQKKEAEEARAGKKQLTETEKQAILQDLRAKEKQVALKAVASPVMQDALEQMVFPALNTTLAAQNWEVTQITLDFLAHTADYSWKGDYTNARGTSWKDFVAAIPEAKVSDTGGNAFVSHLFPVATQTVGEAALEGWHNGDAIAMETLSIAQRLNIQQAITPKAPIFVASPPPPPDVVFAATYFKTPVLTESDGLPKLLAAMHELGSLSGVRPVKLTLSMNGYKINNWKLESAIYVH